MSQLKILIVEDETIIALEIQEYLESMHYCVTAITSSGSGALKSVTENCPDLILMDICLKSEPDGIEVAKKIQSARHIPIIFLTAYSDDGLLERAKTVRPYGYILKPYQRQDLKVAIDMAMYIFKIEGEKQQALDDLQLAKIELEERVEKKTADLKKANESKSKFVAQISHELRTPLHHILSYSGFGVSKIDKVDKEKLLSYFTKIKETGIKMARLLDDILDLSKLESGKMVYEMKEEDLVRITTNVVDEFQTLLKNKELTLNVKIEENIAKVKGDWHRLAQVIRNLLSNAIKFTPPKKEITIRIGPEALEPGKLKKDQNRVSGLSFSIKDEGIGIPENELNLVFKQYIQSSKTKNRAGSTGLGLAISQEIIKAHQGIMSVCNNPQGGAKFSFLLPIV